MSHQTQIMEFLLYSNILVKDLQGNSLIENLVFLFMYSRLVLQDGLLSIQTTENHNDKISKITYLHFVHH